MQDIRIWMENRITNLENMINGTLTPDIMGDDCTPGRGIRDMMQPEARGAIITLL